MKKKVSKPKKVSRPKKFTTIKAKKMAWRAFSAWIRQKYAGPDGKVKCCTCEWRGPWTESQAGHFIDGRNNSVLYNEMLVHPQCLRCNIFLKGNKVAYTLFMAKKYCLTLDQIKELEDLRKETKIMKAHDHIDIYEKYNKLIMETL